MRLSCSDIEESVIAVVAQLAGVSKNHIKPDLDLRRLGCDQATVLDLIDVLEDALDLSLDIRETSGPALSMSLDTVWDIVKLFHRARHGLDIRVFVRVGNLHIRL